MYEEEEYMCYGTNNDLWEQWRKTQNNNRFLSCVIYYLMEKNYVCINYMLFQPKTLISMSSKPTFEHTSSNILLVIGIPELLLNRVSCHGFTKNPNSTLILNCRSRLINNLFRKRILHYWKWLRAVKFSSQWCEIEN